MGLRGQRMTSSATIRLGTQHSQAMAGIGGLELDAEAEDHPQVDAQRDGGERQRNRADHPASMGGMVPAHGESYAPAGGGEPGNGQEPEPQAATVPASVVMASHSPPRPEKRWPGHRDARSGDGPSGAVAQALPELEGHKSECDGRKDDMGVKGDGPQLCMVGHEPHARLDPAQHEAPGRKSDAKVRNHNRAVRPHIRPVVNTVASSEIA